MNNLLSKISLYDILSMVIPGGTILLFLSLSAGYNWKMNGDFVDSLIFYFIVVSLAYIIGIVNHVISSEMWKSLRNNPVLIRKGLEQLKNETGKNISNLSIKNNARDIGIKFLVIVPILLFCYIAFFGYILRSHQCCCVFCIGLILLCTIAIMFISFAIKESKEHDQELIDKYYNAYYGLEVKGKLGAISIIDNQIAFLENMAIPLFLFIFLPEEYWEALFPCITCNPSINCIKLLIILLCISMIYVVYNRAIKVHYLVWCNFHYYKEQDSQVNPKQNQ